FLRPHPVWAPSARAREILAAPSYSEPGRCRSVFRAPGDSSRLGAARGATRAMGPRGPVVVSGDVGISPHTHRVPNASVPCAWRGGAAHCPTQRNERAAPGLRVLRSPARGELRICRCAGRAACGAVSGQPRPAMVKSRPQGRGLDFQGRRPDKDQGAACLGRHRRLRRGTAAASAVRHAAPAPTPRGPRGGGPRICSRLPLLPPSPGRPCLVPAASSFALLGLPRVVFRPLGRPSRVQVVATACPRRFCLQPSWSESVGGARVGGSTASSVRSPGRPGGVLGPLGRPHPVQVVATAGPRRFWLRPSRNEDVGGARVGGSAASRSARASGGRAAVARGCPLLHALGRPQRGRALQPPPAVPSLARQPCPHRQADCRCPGAREETTGRHAVPLAAPLPPWRPDGGTPFSAGPRSSGSSALLAALPPHDYISAGVAGLARCESGTSPASE
ncbi:unnamed protein product, partial [Prorocentrum cordatum]